MRSDAVSNLITAFDIWILHIDRANAQLLVTQQTLEMGSHVMLNQITIAFDFADQIRLVPARIEISMTDLPVVIGADCVIALADMDQHMNILWKPLDRDVNRVRRARTSASSEAVKYGSSI